LQESTCIEGRRERQNKVLNGLWLDNVYGATIERMKGEGVDESMLGMGALMWICYEERPLGPGDLFHSLAIELRSIDFDSGNIHSITTLAIWCKVFIRVDKEGSTVRLIQFSLREYLSAHPHIFSSPHSSIAETT